MNQLNFSGVIVIVAGKISSGKTTIAEFLRDEYNFDYFRTSLVLREIMNQQGLEITDQSLQNFGREFSLRHGPMAVVDSILEHYVPTRNFVYEGLRHPESVDYIREKHPFTKVIYLDTDDQLRYQRYLARYGKERANTYSTFIEREKHPIEQDIPQFKEKADAVLQNNQLGDTQQTVIKLLKQWFEQPT